MNCSEDNMCQIDKDDSIVSEVRLCAASVPDNVNKAVTSMFLSRFRYFNHLSVKAANS